MMNLDNYYLHATGGLLGRYNSNNSIVSILKDNKIKCKKDLGIMGGLHKPDEICLINPAEHRSDKEGMESAFENFALYSPTLVFTKDFHVEKPPLIATPELCSGDTNLYDEVRYKGELSLEKLEFITFPIWNPNYVSTAQIIIEGNIYLRCLNIFKENISIIQNEYGYSVKNIFNGEDIKLEDIDQSRNSIYKTLHLWRRGRYHDGFR